MADRIIGMRSALRENLEKLGSSLSWEHITKQVFYLLAYILSSYWLAQFLGLIEKILSKVIIYTQVHVSRVFACSVVSKIDCLAEL